MQKLYSIFRGRFYLLILTVLIFVPLYPKLPLENVFGTFVAIRLEDVLIAFVFLTWFLLNFKKIISYFRYPIFQAFLLFFGIGFLSLISGIFVTHTVTANLGLFHFVRRVEYMFLFIVAATSITTLKQVKTISIAFLITSIAIIFYGFGQIFLDFPVISTTNSEFSKGLVLRLTEGARVNSTFAGHYDLAVFLSLVLILLASLFFYFKKIMQKVLIILHGVLGFILLGFTAGRISFVATLVGLTFVFLLNKNKLLIAGLFLLTFFSLAVIPELRHRIVATITVNLIGGGGPKYSPPPGKITPFTPLNQIPENKRVQTTDLSTDSATISADTAAGEPINKTELGVYRSFGIRLNVEWPRALNAFYKNPILGSGYSSITLATDNDLLRSLGETGLLGTLSLTLIFVMLIREMWKFLKSSSDFEKYFIIAMLSSIVVILITGTFIDVLEASKIAEIFWILMGISWAVCQNFKVK